MLLLPLLPLPSLHHDGHGLLVTICLILSIRQANPTPRALFFAVRRYLSPWESQHRLSSRDVEMISKSHRCTSKTVGHEPGTFKAKSESRLSRRPNSSKAKTTQRRKRCRHFWASCTCISTQPAAASQLCQLWQSWHSVFGGDNVKIIYVIHMNSFYIIFCNICDCNGFRARTLKLCQSPAPQEAKRCTAACRARRAAPFTSCDVHIQVIWMVDKHMLS